MKKIFLVLQYFFKLKFERKSKPITKFQFTFIDLFCGIGGFRSGLSILGGECVFSNEWDKFANATYEAWYNDNSINKDDIRDLDIEKTVPSHDILCAGFPCQPFSIAGVSKKNSLGVKHGFEEEKQGNLFFSIMRVTDIKRPKVLFLENVKNLQTHDKGKTWKRITDEIEGRHYKIFSCIVDASYCVPQKRKRIFIVCFDKRVFGDDFEFDFPKFNTNDRKILKSIWEKSPDRKYMITDNLWEYLKAYRDKHRKKGNGFGYTLNTKNDVARTLSARYYKDGSEILLRQKGWKNPRRLTGNEAKNLMGFTQKYASLFGHHNGFPQVVSDMQAYKQFGNSVIPQIVEDIGKVILTKMKTIK